MLPLIASSIALALMPSPAEISFKRQVAPILVNKCLACHNDKKAEHGLNLKTYALLRAGGKSLGAEIIEPGDPDTSQLIEVLLPDATPRMPYKQPPLSDTEIGILKRWVAEGAKFDGESEASTPIASLVNPLDGLPDIKPMTPTSAPVTCLAFSFDGTRLAAAVGDEIQIYDSGTGERVASLTSHEGQVNAVLFTPDGKSLIACGGRPAMFGFITIWDVASKAIRQSMHCHGDAVLSADISPDGKILATSSYDRLIKLWDIDPLKELRTLKEHTDAVYGVAFSPDGTRLASAAGDRTVKLWDVQTGKRLFSFADATAEQYTVAFSPDGAFVFGGGVDRTIRGWSVNGAENALALSAFAHDAPILRLAVDRANGRLMSASEDKRIKVWDLATLAARGAIEPRRDWPLAIALNTKGSSLAVGDFDGTITLVDPEAKAAPRIVRAAATTPVAQAKPQEPAKPQLLRYATLGPPSPRAGMRGTTVKITLGGHGIGSATAIHFPGEAIEAKLIPREGAPPDAIDAELTIAPTAHPGLRAFYVRTALGATPAATFLVTTEPEAPEVEPNHDADKATPVKLPAMIAGTINEAGDRDAFRFHAKSGATLVFETLARPMGSSLNAELELLDSSGRRVARATRSEEGREALLVFKPEHSGDYALRVSDIDNTGSGNHYYRIRAGTFPHVDSVFPLAAAAGHSREQEFRAVNMGSPPPSQVVPNDARGGTLLPVLVAISDTDARDTGLRQVVGVGASSVEIEPNNALDQAGSFSAPGGVSGRIDTPGDTDLHRFSLKRGERFIIELYGRRLGTPIDATIELLDARGSVLERAVLRPTRQTSVAFRDHPSTGRNIRLVYPWTGFSQGDYVLMGREVSRIAELPRNLDDDAVFWGLGNPRNNTGDRIGLLGTTPEHHPIGQPIVQVEIHPPGSKFPPGGMSPTTIYYRNDDGGPGFGKDSMLDFVAPETSEYLVRVGEMRGTGGPDFGYYLVVRKPEPDFTLSLSSENLNIPRGSSITVPVNIVRQDGFDGAVDVTLENLPPGIRALGARIEPEQFTADLWLMAAADAPNSAETNWTLTARSVPDKANTNEIKHTLDPGGPKGGWITVTPGPNLQVAGAPERIEIIPGHEASMTLKISHHNGFTGRVPIDVRNLPFGVRVLNIGLNGVLVTEQQTERTITLYAEPWVAPQSRHFFAAAQCEPAGTSDSSQPFLLVVGQGAPSSGETPSPAH